MTTFRDIVRGFNIFLIALIALALAAAAAICFVVAADIVAPADIGPEGWFRDQFVELDALTGADRTIAIVATAAAFAFGLLLLVFESVPALFPSRLYGTDASGRGVLIDRRTIRQMVENSALEVEDVTSANARLRDTGSGMQVRLKAGLVPAANITEAGRKLESRIKDDLRDLAGVSISSVRLELEYQPQAARRGRERTDKTEREHPTPV